MSAEAVEEVEEQPVFEEAPVPVAVAPVAHPKPIQVSEADRLQAENLNLRLLNCVNRETILQLQLNELSKERQGYNERMQQMQHEIETKYGISLRTHHILPDSGMVVPRNPQPGMDPRMAAMLQKQ